MIAHDRLAKWIGWALIAVSGFVASLGTYSYLTGPTVIVTISPKQRTELGSPRPYKPLVDESVYQGLYENGLVLWVDGRFFELGLDGQYFVFRSGTYERSTLVYKI